MKNGFVRWLRWAGLALPLLLNSCISLNPSRAAGEDHAPAPVLAQSLWRSEPAATE